jgi:hypothetical protein
MESEAWGEHRLLSFIPISKNIIYSNNRHNLLLCYNYS